MNNSKCVKCNKSLVSIGDKRKNGTGNDWDNRKMHKKCWKEDNDMVRIQAIMDSMKKHLR